MTNDELNKKYLIRCDQ